MGNTLAIYCQSIPEIAPLGYVRCERQRLVAALRSATPRHLDPAHSMLEELRLSLFAQHLPTAEPVSLQRITKVLSGG